MRVVNKHERSVTTNAEDAAAIFESLGTRKDRLWPKQSWPPMRLDAPKSAGGSGGHGPIRYTVTDHQPGARTTFTFENEGLSRGLVGTHTFELEPLGADSFVARHVIDATLRWPAIVLWPLVIRPLHDALVEDALDNFEKETTSTVANPNRHSPYVRFLRSILPA